MKLLIKGTKEQAVAAAYAHNITTFDLREHEWQSGSFETLAHAHIDNRNKVVSWFINNREEAPFPVGTLLWYAD